MQKGLAAILRLLAIHGIVMPQSLHAENEFFRQEDVHQHGQVQLNVVMEGNRVMLEMQSPMVNLLGFEHMPETTAEFAQLKEVVEQVSNHRTLIELVDANCSQVRSNVKTPGDEAEGHNEHQAHAAFTTEEHQEMLIQYELDCRREITALRFEGFSNFSGINRAVIQWITNSSQGGATLSPGNTLAPLK